MFAALDMNTATITPYVGAVHRLQVMALWETVIDYEATHNKPSLVIDKKVEVGQTDTRDCSCRLTDAGMNGGGVYFKGLPL
jgi:hypothetical protein